jgi:hypothetical protein
MALVVLMSCDKKDKTPTPTLPAAETEITNKAITVANGYTITGVPPNNTAEYGLGFNVSRAGKITRLGCRMPGIENYTVSVWDPAAPSTAIARATVPVSVRGTPNYVNITPIALTPNKNYVISINLPFSLEYYVCSKPGITNLFPIATGSVNFTEGRKKVTLPIGNTGPTFPTTVDNAIIYGFPDFVFQPD